MEDRMPILVQDSQVSCVNVAELEEQLLQSAHAGQLLLERNQVAETEVKRLSDLVVSLELKVDHLNEDLEKAREQDEELQHLGNTVAVLEQKNESLQQELRQSWRQRDESENKFREDLQNLKAAHDQLESEHIAQGEAHDEECNRLRFRCRSLVEKEGSLQTLLEASRGQEHELKHELAALKARSDLTDSLSSEHKLASASACEDKEHPLESKVTELESQLISVRQENRDLLCHVEELQLKLEEVAQDAEEMHETLISTQKQCHMLEQKALEAYSLLHDSKSKSDAKCDSEVQRLHAEKPTEVHEKNKIQNITGVLASGFTPPSRVRQWFSLSKLGHWGQPSKTTVKTAVASDRATDVKIDTDLNNAMSSPSSSNPASDSEDNSCPKSRNDDEVKRASQAKAKLDLLQQDHLKMRASLRLRGGVQRKQCICEERQVLSA